MKAELIINTEELATLIATRVIEGLKASGEKPGGASNQQMDVKALAAYLGVSTQWVYEKVQYKRIPHAKMGKLLRFDKAMIDQWRAGQAIPTTEPLQKMGGKRPLD